MLEMIHDGAAMLFEDGEGDEEMELAAEPVRPESLPEAKDVAPFELALEPDQQHAKEEEEIGRVGRLQM